MSNDDAKIASIDSKSPNIYLELSAQLEHIIFDLTQENLELSFEKTMELFDQNYPYTSNLLISNLIYEAFCSHNDKIYIYLNFLEKMNSFNQEIVEIFSKHISVIDSQESYYLIYQMIKRNLIDASITKNIKTKYFAQYKTEEENKERNFVFPSEGIFLTNYEELSKNGWELHKKFIEEGHNPDEIAKIIRNDEIEKLQEISSQNNFDFNQIIEPSLYERCDFINQFGISLIDYAAFFSSVKCFKYLLMNNANVKNAGKYAVAGGNIEIIHLCEQNHSSFEDAYEAAIQFHKNDFFLYIYDNKIEEINDLEELGKICVSHNNYTIFTYLLNKGMKINENIIDESARIGNLFLTKISLKKFKFQKTY